MNGGEVLPCIEFCVKFADSTFSCYIILQTWSETLFLNHVTSHSDAPIARHKILMSKTPSMDFNYKSILFFKSWHGRNGMRMKLLNTVHCHIKFPTKYSWHYNFQWIVSFSKSLQSFTTADS